SRFGLVSRQSWGTKPGRNRGAQDRGGVAEETTKYIPTERWHLGGLKLAPKCYSHLRGEDLISWASSSGGGLPGRPLTRKSRDACLIFGVNIPPTSQSFQSCGEQKTHQRPYLPISSALPKM